MGKFESQNLSSFIIHKAVNRTAFFLLIYKIHLLSFPFSLPFKSHSSFTSSIISRQRCNEKLCCHSPHTHNHKFMWFSVNMKFVAHLKMGFCGFHNTFWSLSLARSVAFIYCLFSVFTTPNGIVYTYRKYLTSKKTEKKKEEGGGEIN